MVSLKNKTLKMFSVSFSKNPLSLMPDLAVVKQELPYS